MFFHTIGKMDSHITYSSLTQDDEHFDLNALTRSMSPTMCDMYPDASVWISRKPASVFVLELTKNAAQYRAGHNTDWVRATSVF